MPDEHRHLLDVDARKLCCVCRACAILFDRSGAGGGHYRMLPDRRRYLKKFVLDEQVWDGLRIPVRMAFFYHDTAAGRVVAFYPSPAGAVESLLDLAEWQRIEAGNPVLRQLQPDVEALLVNRSRDFQDYFMVPIDDCYTLVGLIRTGWKGLSGGSEVWEAIDGFFARLRKGATDG